ncbi:MAG: helix-turn-helix transcriptional regulator, partial [Sphaerochaeta sp.]
GLTPVELLELQRINIAKEKLALTNELLKNIAELVGFPNIHHFSRSFKRVVGIPPGEYRKNFQNGIRKDILFSRDFKNELNIEIAGNSSEFDKL